MIVTFLPDNIKQTAKKGEKLLSVAARSNIMIDGSCSGKGTCGKCKVQIKDGEIAHVDNAEKLKLTTTEIENNYRLACRFKINNDITVIIPQSNAATTRKTKLNFMPENFLPTGHIKKRFLEIEPATLNNQHADEERLISALGNKKFKVNSKLFANIAQTLKVNQNKITVALRNDEIIAIEGGDTSNSCYGIAFDTGTTTVVGMLWNMVTGEAIGVSAVTNPQSVFGADVISRINYASESQTNLETMQNKIINCFNEIIEGFELSYRIETDKIYEMTVVGNTTMSHLLMGVNPEQLAMAPFQPVFCTAITNNALEMGFIINPLANIHILPNIAGHVGSDIIAGIIATKLADQEGLKLFVDIGTNGEIVLAKNGKLMTCSTAAGPAFEGATIYQGMRAATGAIEIVRITGDTVIVETIENKEPVGICGSGLIDAVAEMLKSGVVERSGRMLDEVSALNCGISEEISKRLRKGEKGKEFVLVYKKNTDDIVITQKDIREVQMAKAAIYAGITIMLKKMEETKDELKGIIVAGAFGNYINKESALEIGLFPKINKKNIISAGNAAAVGASMSLLSLNEREEANKQARRIEHIELAAQDDFQDEYINAMKF